MNKNDLTIAVRDAVRQQFPSAPIDVIQATVNATFSSIMEIVTEGNSVVIAGFGKFESIDRSERLGRNPRTGDSVVIPAKTVPVFSPGKDFKRLVEFGLIEH